MAPDPPQGKVTVNGVEKAAPPPQRKASVVVPQRKVSTAESTQILIMRKCPADATEIELKFQSMTDREFLIGIEAPSGEKSQLLHFKGAGVLQRFIPTTKGCGHGDWYINVFEPAEEGGYLRQTTKSTQLTADGTGSLFFTVNDDLQPVLTSKVWKDLPKDASCKTYRIFGSRK